MNEKYTFTKEEAERLLDAVFSNDIIVPASPEEMAAIEAEWEALPEEEKRRITEETGRAMASREDFLAMVEANRRRKSGERQA